MLSTFGCSVSEVVTGLRHLPHDHLVVMMEKGNEGLDGHRQLLSLLDRLKVNHQTLVLDQMDLTGSAFLIEEMVRVHKNKGWQVLVDITGGSKLLSDAAVLAAVATGSELCCFEGQARRVPLLGGMGVKELLPKEVAEALSTMNWPMPMGHVQRVLHQNAGGGVLMKMKKMDLVSLRDVNESPHLCLTDRGQACLDWLIRMGEGVNRSSG